MLLTTQAGILVNSDHIAFIALRRKLPSPSEPEPEPGIVPVFRVLLCMANGDYLVGVRELPLSQARFVPTRRCGYPDIANSWADGKPRWKASESLKRIAEGAYFAEDSSDSTESTENEESEVNGGTSLSPLHDV